MKRLHILTTMFLLTGCITLNAAEDIIPAYTPPLDVNIAPLQLPEMYHATLENGLRIITIPQHEVPTVTFTLAIPGGAICDPTGREGTAVLTGLLLDRGTVNRSGAEFAEEADYLAVEIQGWANWYNSFIFASGLTRHSDAMLSLVGDMLLHPSFPEAELEISRNRMLTRRRQELDAPARLTRKIFNRTVYADSRFALPLEGDLETLPEITRGDVLRFYETYFTPVRAELIVVGDVDHASVLEQVRRHLGVWSSHPVTFPLPVPPTAVQPQVILINKPDATNANFRFGHLGVPRNHPDFHALRVMNYILGGSGMASRLMERIRTELGYTYGIYSRMNHQRDTGAFSVGAAVTAEHLGSAIEEAQELIEQLQREPVSEDELRVARNFLAASYLLNFEDPDYLAYQILDAHVYGYAESEIAAYTDRIQAVTREDILRVAREHLAPERTSYIFCGDAAVLEEQAAAFGSVQTREID